MQSSRKYKAGPTGAVGCGARRGKHRHSGEAAASLDEKGKLSHPSPVSGLPGESVFPAEPNASDHAPASPTHLHPIPFASLSELERVPRGKGQARPGQRQAAGTRPALPLIGVASAGGGD